MYTLPVLRALAADGHAASKLQALLGKPLDDAELDTALALVRADGAVPAAIAEARCFADAAVAALEPFGESPAAAWLAQAARTLVAPLG